MCLQLMSVKTITNNSFKVFQTEFYLLHTKLSFICHSKEFHDQNLWDFIHIDKTKIVFEVLTTLGKVFELPFTAPHHNQQSDHCENKFLMNQLSNMYIFAEKCRILLSNNSPQL